MAVKTYNYNLDRNKKLSAHFSVWEFVTASDYNGSYPTNILIDDGLPTVLEQVYSHFNCSRADISSGYRTSACDKAVGGSGSGPHTQGIAVDVCFYKNNAPIPSRIIACYLQDIGIKGIGVFCGGTLNWTHFDMRTNSVWYGDERDYSAGHANYYSYTGTTKAEVYPTNSTTNTTINSNSTTKMKTSDKMINIIKTYEGLSLKACKAISSEQYWTIGYGHYGPDVKVNQTITESEAEKLLRNDLKIFEECVNSAVKSKLTQSQFDACVSLAYNIGTGAFTNSDIVKFINSNRYGHACVDFPSWRKAGGQVLEGLKKRRQTEMEFFGSGMDFTLTENINIRTNAGTNYPIKKVSQISSNGKKCVLSADPNSNAIFKKGTEITALELKAVSNTTVDVWCRCPSGWVCIRHGNEVYVD